MKSSDSLWRFTFADVFLFFHRSCKTYYTLRPGLIAPCSSIKPLPYVFLLLLVYYLRKNLSLSISDWFWGVCNFQNLKILPIKSIFKIIADVWCDLSKLGREGHKAIKEKIKSTGLSPTFLLYWGVKCRALA